MQGWETTQSRFDRFFFLLSSASCHLAHLHPRAQCQSQSSRRSSTHLRVRRRKSTLCRNQRRKRRFSTFFLLRVRAREGGCLRISFKPPECALFVMPRDLAYSGEEQLETSEEAVGNDRRNTGSRFHLLSMSPRERGRLLLSPQCALYINASRLRMLWRRTADCLCLSKLWCSFSAFCFFMVERVCTWISMRQVSPIYKLEETPLRLFSSLPVKK